MFEKLLNVLMRGICGAIIIFFVNMILERKGISLGVGLNPFTLLTSGILGLPGLGVLYGIGIYKSL